MNYEERYNAALSRARHYYLTGKGEPVDFIKMIFPELAEDKDEQIRKGIIRNLQYLMDRSEGFVKEDLQERIAWLEKQSKKKSADEVLKIRQEVYQSGYNDGYKHGQEDITKSLSIGENINHTDIKEKAHQIAWETSKDYDPSLSKEAWCEIAALDMASWLGKQGEQNQAWKPNDAQLIVIKDLIEDKNTSKVNKVILRGMLGEIEDTCSHEIEKQDEFPRTNIEIPFGANDSELQEVSYYIPKGFYAEIKDDRVVIKKVEPKFHEEDWIVTSENKVLQITSIEGTSYRFNNESHYWEIYYCDKKCHLWTIEDAESGDVLAFDDDTVVIFKDLYNSSTFHSYCHIKDGIFDISKDDMPDWWEGKEFQPATKEQRDLLFQKMVEEGYFWDSEKKELQKM